MESLYSESNIKQALLTMRNVSDTISQLIMWNEKISSSADYNRSMQGMQLLAGNCTLITAIGEGINRCSRLLPDFLSTNFPEIPWKSIVGMRNHICHGYFELDADVVFDAVKNDIPVLQEAIQRAIKLLLSMSIEDN